MSDNPIDEAMHALADELWLASGRVRMLAKTITAPPPSVPRGWVLVPVEPTDEMVEAAWDSDAADYVGEHKRIHSLGLAWSAMLAAAPSAQEVGK